MCTRLDVEKIGSKIKDYNTFYKGKRIIKFKEGGVCASLKTTKILIRDIE